MFIFLCAEVTAISVLINYISGTEFWITALVVLTSTLIYTLYGGLKASIFTDNIQMIVIGVLLIISFIYITSFTGSKFSFDFVVKKNPQLLSSNYIPNYTAGLTFFIAVAATNLFHQGNWQRVFAAKNNLILKKSLIYSSIITLLIVLWMGYTGLISFSLNSKVIPDLAFFDLILSKNFLLIISILVLALALTLSTIDTLINAISSILIVNGNQISKSIFGNSLKNKTNYIILLLCILVFIKIGRAHV